MDSIWTDGDAPAFPRLMGDAKTDVLIIGGGLSGVLCAHMLTKAGVDCLLVEANTIGSGITKNTTAKLSIQHGLVCHKLLRRFGAERTRLYLDANREALALYRSLCRDIPCDFQEQDSFLFSRDSREPLDWELEALERLGYPAKFASPLPLPFPTAGAVCFPGQAQFHPLKFLRGIARGLPVREHTPIREMAPNAARTERGTIHFQKAIVATHFPFLNKHGSFFLKMYQSRSYVLALDNAPDLKGMYLDYQENGLSFRNYGSVLLLGGGGHRTGKPGSGWADLEIFARENYPQARILRRWATQDCMTLDGLPYVGQYSRRTPNLYVATGFNKWGMTNSMAAAQLLTALLTDTPTPYAAVFSPSRSMLRPQLAVNGFEAVRSICTLTPRRCPHLGCALRYNPQEHTWDCPCHGSRFQESGKLIDNPATGDLKPRE